MFAEPSETDKNHKRAVLRLGVVIAAVILLTLSLTVGGALRSSNPAEDVESTSRLSTSSAPHRAGAEKTLTAESPRPRALASKSTSTNASLALDGKGTYVAVPNSPGLNITGPLTVDAWIKTNGKTQQGIVEHYDHDGGFALQLTANGKLEFFTISGNKQKARVKGVSTVTTNAWHHVAGVFDGGELRVFLDGVLDGRNSSSLAPASTTADLKIGASGDSGGGFFSGLIDDVRVTAGIRFAANFTPELRLTAGGLILGSEKSGTRGLWSFDDQSTSDSSGHNHNGSLIGGAEFSTEIPGKQAPIKQVFAAQTAGLTSVLINFDDVFSGTRVDTYYLNQGKNIKFTSEDGGFSIARNNSLSFPKSPPNILDTGFVKGVMVDFPKPVNDLKFYITDCNDFFTIALLDVYQGTAVRHFYVSGCNPSHPPLLQDFNMLGLNGITKIVVFNIRDYAGLSYDDFSFTFASPTPSPSPSPSPTPIPTPTPPPPTNVKVTPDEEELTVTWTPAQGAGWYTIQRSPNQPSSSAEPLTSGDSALSSTPFFCDNINNPCKITEGQLDSNTTFTYQVFSANNGGTNTVPGQASGKPLPRSACSEPTLAVPAPGPAGSQVFWSMNYEVTPNDGLTIRNISLAGRKMAERFSVPYFLLKVWTDGQNPVQTRGELRPNGSNPDGTLRSRLIKFDKSDQPGSLVKIFKATYAIDRIPGAPKACLTVTQNYQFFPQGFRSPEEWPGPCEPSEELEDCTKFRPMIQYSFKAGDKEHLDFLTIPQRLHFQLDEARAKNGNRVGIFRDRDSRLEAIGNRTGFEDGRNPLQKEIIFPALVDGQKVKINYPPLYQAVPPNSPRSFDNFHQTWKTSVLEPMVGFSGGHWRFPAAGCPECVHMHWRWGSFFDYEPFGAGYPLLPPKPAGGNNQKLDISIVKWKFGEEDPTDYTQLINPEPANERMYHPLNPSPSDAVVMWYVSTGFRPDDKFFWHTAWFIPRNPDKSNVNSSILQNFFTTGGAAAAQDGPISINLGDVYHDGPNQVDNYDLSTLPPLPAGYSALNNTAYKITTEAVASGPYTIGFSAASIPDQAIFNNLRIFHPEPDPFDPERPMWVDVTVLSPDSPAPDYSSRTISGRSEELGVYVIAKSEGPAPANEVANLSITSSDSSDPIVAGNTLTYTVTVTNSAPQIAHDVLVRDDLAPEVLHVSATPSQGNCKEIEGSVYCDLGSINAGASATIALVVKTKEGDYPAGSGISNTASVRGRETDNDQNNNSVDEVTTILPNPNVPPIVAITAPSTDGIVAGPANIQIIAIAADSDGSISTVDFFDNEEFIGAGIPSGGSYIISKSNLSFGRHTFLAAATDNEGRQTLSNAVNLIVNGPATVSIVSPSSQALGSPGSNIVISANANHPSGTITKVEFFANTALLGVGVPAGGNRYDFSWNNIVSAKYSLVAVVTDDLGIKTTSAPVVFTVGTPPTVSITAPGEGALFPSLTNIGIAADAQTTSGSVEKVDFYSNGALIGTATDSGSNRFTISWRQVPDGPHSLTAVATDTLGLSSTSTSVNIAVNTTPTRPGEFAWFDDALPPGASPSGDGETWHWVDANPGSFSGRLAHQSRTFAQTEVVHQHYFVNSPQKLPVNVGDKLFTYVFLDIHHMPREIMLQWHDGNNWEHRAYWGENRIGWGTDGTESRRYMGPLPKTSQWVRLEIPASAVGLEGHTLSGMAFTLYGGRATWDLSGKTTPNAPPAPTSPPGDFVWIEDGLPAGATPALIDDVWNWVPGPVHSGQSAHQSFFRNNDDKKFRSHSFTGAQAPMNVNPGDVLFTYVYLGDPDLNHQPNTPDEIMLQWYDGSSWEHRAFWGENYIGQQIPNTGVQGTEGQRYMGGLPAARGWYRLEVPASYVGLEGKSISGMAFSVFRSEKNPFVTWDRSGRSSQLTTVPLPLSATSGVWLSKSPTLGYGFETNDQGLPDHYPQQADWFFVHPNQAAGTVPFYRFRQPQRHEYFYSRHRDAHPGWEFAGIAYYVYPDGSTPGTAPLHLFHDSAFHYFLSTNRDNLPGMIYDGVWAHVFPVNPQVPAPPSSMTLGACGLFWRDNSANELGFKLETYSPSRGTWDETILGPNSTRYCFDGNNCTFTGLCATVPGYRARVRAFNDAGHSAYSNIVENDPESITASAAQADPVEDPPTATPYVGITSPANSEVVDRTFAVVANAFDSDGNGTIVKVEFFTNGNKVGEITNAPYVFVWKDAAPGIYNLTARATDNAGAVTTSNPVDVIVAGTPTVTLTSPANGAVFDAPATVTITASASSPGGSISKVEFFQSLTKLGEAITAPYSFAWPDVPGGSYSITAKVTDNSGATSLSDTINITVNGSNVAPAVSVTAPANGAAFTAPASISINASASDSDGTISKVEFFQDSTKLGETSTAPYSFVWANVAAGSYSLTARATDNLGTATTSGAVNITVNNSNVPPATSVTAPTNGAVFTAPASININASASDSDGAISKVEFFNGPGKLGEDSTAPYSFSWTNVPAGSYSLTAVATDNLGVTTTSSAVNIAVGNSNVAPNISITSPANGAVFNATNTYITINATASDSDGSISKVEFFQGSTKLGEDSTSPYSFAWSNFTAGSYSLTARATDNLGATTTSGAVSITLNQPPVAHAGGPYSGTAGTAVQFTGGASSDPEGPLAAYSWNFGDGGTASGVAPAHPYATAGTYTVTLTVTDNNGAQASANTTVNIGGGGGNTNGYIYRRSITLDHTRVPNSDQVNFPVLISGTYPYLATVANSGNVRNANGYDIIFTSDFGCATRLNHEVEIYNPTSGAVTYWVKVPNVSSTSDTIIYMCYGNPNIATDQSNKTAVWDSNYKGVWHLPNGATLSAADSTANGNHGAISGPTATAGRIDGGSNSFNGADHINAGSGASLNITGALTITAWIKMNSFGQNGRNPIAFNSLNSTLTIEGYNFLVGDGGGATKFIGFGPKSNGNVAVIQNVVDVGAWYYVVVVSDGANPTFYVNGANVGTGSSITSNPSANPLYIGNYASLIRGFDGIIDELRILSTQRTAEWIATEYNNQSSPDTFYNISSATVTNQPPVANAGGPYSGTAGQGIQFYGTGYDPDGAITSYFWNFGDGGTGSGATPAHAYSSAGSYTATLTVTDNGGAQSSANATVTVSAANQQPVAHAGTARTGTTGSPVQFTAGGSYDPDGSIASYAWNFGDGATGSGVTPSHTYIAPGTYNVSLTVTDNSGATGTAVVTATITSASAPTGGLVGYWKFDENSGATAVDSSGSGNTGTLTSGASWVAGQRGAAVNFDGADDYVQVGPRSSLVMSNAATFSAWIYPTGWENGIIVNKEGEYEIARFPDGSIQWAFANGNPGWAWVNTGHVAFPNQWTHVAVTYDTGSIKTYINGTLTQSYAGAGAIADVDGGSNDFRIGGRQCCQQNFPGRLDEVRVYNRALSAAEVASLPYGASAANQPPVANAGGPYSGIAGTAVQFNGSGSDPDGIIAGYSWNFDNGGSATGASSSYTYSTAGSYTATLTVTDNNGAQSSASAPVAISSAQPAMSATFVSQTIPSTSMVAGQNYNVSVTMKNTGSNTWTSANLYRLGSQNPQDNLIWNIGRVDLPASVASGGQASFNFTIKAPATPGTYNFQWRMVQDGVMWFGDLTPNVVINVVSGTSNAPPTYYQASADFSAVHGQRNWYYLDSTGAEMVFLNQWGGVWQTPNTSVYLGPGWGHPGDPADAVRQWRAPGAGSIRITGTAFDSDAGGGDGVIVSIRKGTQVLWERTIENANATGFSYDVTTNVIPGDQINFVINRRSNTYWDSTGFDPTIAYTAGGGPPTAGLAGYWKFDENNGSSAADSSASGIHGTLQNGPTWTTGRSRAALNFDGADDFVSSSGLANVTNNFTLSFWALPSATHEIDGESTSGYGGTSGQRYAFWPAWYDAGHCGVGVSVGTNGVSVYEHAANYMPATLVHSATLSGWTHITVVYENRQPRLYLNGILVKTGLTSPMSFVHMNPYYIGGPGYGYYAGKLDEVSVYNRALTATEVATLPFSSGTYSAEAAADFSPTQNPTGSWSYGYKSTGGLFTLYSGTSTGFGAGTNTWALPGQNCCPMVTRNNTGATYTYPAAPSVVQPADVLNLHPGPNNERSIVRWAAPAAGTYSIQGRFQGIDTSGTTTDVLVTHNGTTVFSANVNGYTNTAPFSLTRTVGAGDTIEFSAGYGSNGTYNSDSTGLSATITAYGRMNVAQSASGAVASASSTYNANYPASGANNGDRKLGYGSGGAWHSSTNTFPQWLQIDFNGTKTIDEVDVFTLQNSYASPADPTEAMTFTLYGLTGFEVQYWNGGAWVPVPGGSINGNNKVWRKITFAPLTTSKIRVVTNASVDGWTRITEVEAWGTPTGSIGGGGNTNGYAHRRSITIDHNKVANTDQADFPVLLSGTYSYLATAANGGNVQNANGYDVVFTSDSGCANKLNHEVETYNAATGVVNYWVKVPTVSHTSDSVFYMCYGNDSITADQSNRTAVWNGSYKGVWHLANGTSLSTMDSTANANHGSSNSASATAGRIAGAASYNGAGQSTVISNPANFDFEHNQAFTMEFWLKKPLDTVTNQTLISKKNTYWTGPGFQVWFWAGSNTAIFDLVDSADTWHEISSVVNVQDNTWHHVVATYDGSSNRSGMRMYVDGILTSTGPPVAIANTIRNSYNLTWGTNSVSQYDYFNGTLDELRFSSAARSADWIKTQYNNQNSPGTFYTISASGG